MFSIGFYSRKNSYRYRIMYLVTADISDLGLEQSFSLSWNQGCLPLTGKSGLADGIHNAEKVKAVFRMIDVSAEKRKNVHNRCDHVETTL